MGQVRGIWEIPVLFTQFFCNLKTAFKDKINNYKAKWNRQNVVVIWVLKYENMTLKK